MDAASIRECVDRIGAILDGRACRELERRFGDVEPASGDALDALVPRATRRRMGAFFTPADVADQIAAAAIDADGRGRVVDLSCGDGALLAAVRRRSPSATVAGVEQELVFAAAAAAALEGGDAEIVWGDGLEARPEWADATAVVGNPPYVGEKGNRELFAAVRAAHPDLDRWFGARIDLHYLFVHRGLDLLAAGGRLAYLTSEYWLAATGARRLREDLTARATDLSFERLGSGVFGSAPGHHSLLFCCTRRHADLAGDGRTWHPFAELERPNDGLPLRDVCLDRQGFVSGADRVSARLARRYGFEHDEPIFVWHAEEVPPSDRDLFRPLVRRSDCVANAVFITPPQQDFVLWSDGSESPAVAARLKVILEPFREALADRREARQGSMAWHRIWWPRRTNEYARPKLVVPRRATAPAFCLDLSGAHVSSDCTFLLAPDEVDDPVGWLVRVMLAANTPAAADQLRAFGKTKGDIIEFYAAPLQNWRLALRVGDGGLELVDSALEERARQISVDCPSAPEHDRLLTQ